ncbi:MAG: AarF/UbiB family protein [Terriglobales bacterium]
MMIEILAALLPQGSRDERIAAIEGALRSDAGPFLRQQISDSLAELLPAEVLVPDVYSAWRPLVRDAMAFVVLYLSDARLAPKLVAQLELPPNTSPEVRLLRLIAKMPGFQKLGQVLARNRHLNSALRDALSELENEISDVDCGEIQAVIGSELHAQLATYEVEVEPEIFSEASVSAVVRFTWSNPENDRRERGVFKVLKPHIPDCFSEDMELLRQLAEFLEQKHHEYGFAENVLTDTFTEVRRLLEDEVDFVREQKTLRQAFRLYRDVRGVRVPRLIAPLCASNITAITEERGVKITEAVSSMSAAQRRRLAEHLIEALVAVPLFAPEGQAMFHADPHAGNLLFDESSGELVLLDWALTEALSPGQQHELAMLLLMLVLRDAAGISRHILALQNGAAADRKETNAAQITECVSSFLDRLPLTRLPNSMDAMRLLDRLAMAGVQFPAPLIMWRKALFTLDGILHEIAGADFSMDLVLARHALESWTGNYNFRSPLSLADLIGVQSSALFYGARLWTQWARAFCSATPGMP